MPNVFGTGPVKSLPKLYFSVPRSHASYRTSQLAEMEVLSEGWKHCMVFWHRVLTDHHLYHHRLIQRLAYATQLAPERGQWMGKFKTSLETFGWQDAFVPLWLV